MKASEVCICCNCQRCFPVKHGGNRRLRCNAGMWRDDSGRVAYTTPHALGWMTTKHARKRGECFAYDQATDEEAGEDLNKDEKAMTQAMREWKTPAQQAAARATA